MCSVHKLRLVCPAGGMCHKLHLLIILALEAGEVMTSFRSSLSQVNCMIKSPLMKSQLLKSSQSIDNYVSVVFFPLFK